jgi:VanZ family protein
MIARRQTMRRLAAFLLVVSIAALSWAGLEPRLSPPGEHQFDKLAHAVAFAYLSSLAWVALAGALARQGALLALVGFGAAIEIAQHMVPGREGSVGDLAADVAGIASGVVLARALSGFGDRRRSAAG